jgi:hypothetical protein
MIAYIIILFIFFWCGFLLRELLEIEPFNRICESIKNYKDNLPRSTDYYGNKIKDGDILLKRYMSYEYNSPYPELVIEKTKAVERDGILYYMGDYKSKNSALNKITNNNVNGFRLEIQNEV